ncbi:hypothetical protein BDN72DRAFT_883319, partial [Pluteus cervinus]
MPDSTAAHRALYIPELLRNFFFAIPDSRDNYRVALVCRAWSDIALDVLWYQVDDICTLFGALVPLTKGEDSREFVRSPEPQDWLNFEKYGHRVKKLIVESAARLPAQSAFDEIARTRIQHKILPNLWCLHWLVDPIPGLIFFHSGIQDLAVWIDHDLPDKMNFFMRNACFFGPNVETLEIKTGYTDQWDPSPVGDIVTELSSWLAQLHDLRDVTLPRFWTTTRVFKALSQRPHLASFGFDYTVLGGYGTPLDTLEFTLVSDSEAGTVFPSLKDFSQNAPFLETIRFIPSWEGSHRLTELTIASQILESPEAYRSVLDIVVDHCPQLTWLGLTCLVTPYRYHPRPSSQHRLTLDTFLPLHKLKCLNSLEITHTLPFALSDEDFLVLVKEWSKMETLRFGYDPYPIAEDAIHHVESPLSPPPAEYVNNEPVKPIYPTMGLLQSIRSLRKHCPLLAELYLSGIDDFATEEDHIELMDDELTRLPFPVLTALSFGTSLITSENVTVALALSQYLSPNVTFTSSETWGGDQNSPYLTYLNLKPIFPLRDELFPSLQDLIDSADPDPSDPEDISVDEPVGANGIIDEDTASELEERRKIMEEIASLLPALSEARQDEREKARKRCNCHDR